MNQAVRLKPSFEPLPAEAVVAPPKARAANSPKSLRTRGRILEAAMRLFVQIGYHEATNAKIAEAARLTRGAMLYHFPDRESLIEAVVPFIQAARTRLLQDAMNAAPHGAERIDYTIDAYWRLLSTEPFTAFAELELAARTDAALAVRLADAQAAFDRGEIGEHIFDLIQGGGGPAFPGEPRPRPLPARGHGALEAHLPRRPSHRAAARHRQAGHPNPEPKGLHPGALARRLNRLRRRLPAEPAPPPVRSSGRREAETVGG